VTIGVQLDTIRDRVNECAAAGDAGALQYQDEILCKCICNKNRPRSGTEQTSKASIRSAYTEANQPDPNWFSVRNDLNAADN
jgi:hypothetical protein